MAETPPRQTIATTRPAQSQDPGKPNSLIPRSMDEAIKLAGMMARANLGVPDHLRGDPGTCLLIVEQAQRWNMSPFAVAMATSNIKGKLSFEGKLIAAALQSTGAIVGEFDYDFEGDPAKPETLSVVASAVRASDGKRKEIRLSWSRAKTDNKFWVIQPEQQLCYASARVWGRRWTPGPLLGVYTPEEFEAPSPPPYAGTTIEGVAEGGAQAQPTAYAGMFEIVPDVPPDAPSNAKSGKPTTREFLEILARDLDAAEDAEAVESVANAPQVTAALGAFQGAALIHLKGLIAAARDRTARGGDF